MNGSCFPRAKRYTGEQDFQVWKIGLLMWNPLFLHLLGGVWQLLGGAGQLMALWFGLNSQHPLWCITHSWGRNEGYFSARGITVSGAWKWMTLGLFHLWREKPGGHPVHAQGYQLRNSRDPPLFWFLSRRPDFLECKRWLTEDRKFSLPSPPSPHLWIPEVLAKSSWI